MESNTVDETIQHATKPENKDESSQHSKAQSMDETSQSSKVENSEIQMLRNQKLSDEQLLILFSHFPVDELVSAQRVCSRWRAVALDKSLWENFTLTLSGEKQDEKYIRTMPALRNIDGDTNNDLVDVILETTTELVSMNCKFEPPLTSSQTRLMLEKYPKLQSISLDIHAPDLLESVNILKTSESLKEVNFTTHRSYKKIPQYQVRKDLSRAYCVFLYDEYFTALTDMDISYTDNVLLHAIKKRSSNLLSLKLTSNVSKEFLDAVSMCTELHKLQLHLSRYFYSELPFHIKIENMNQLRSLHIKAVDDFLPTLYDSLFRGSWLHLTEVSFVIWKKDLPEMNLLNATIENMRQLRKLRYRSMTQTVCEKEFQNSGDLPHLEKLIIDGLQNFTNTGISYISECKNLRYFLLHTRKSEIDNYRIAYQIMPMNKLERMVLGINKTYRFLSCRQEIKEFISSNC